MMTGMRFSLEKAIEVLERTPVVLRTLLEGLSQDWTSSTEGNDTWSPYDIVGHLIHGEKTDWIPRARIILSDRAEKVFPAFDRFAQFQDSQGKSLNELLEDFARFRSENLALLRSFELTETDLHKEGIHPALGPVNLAQLLATWVVHDLDHLAQAERVMARQYKEAVGPWIEFLPVLTR